MHKPINNNIIKFVQVLTRIICCQLRKQLLSCPMDPRLSVRHFHRHLLLSSFSPRCSNCPKTRTVSTWQLPVTKENITVKFAGKKNIIRIVSQAARMLFIYLFLLVLYYYLRKIYLCYSKFNIIFGVCYPNLLLGLLLRFDIIRFILIPSFLFHVFIYLTIPLKYT